MDDSELAHGCLLRDAIVALAPSEGMARFAQDARAGGNPPGTLSSAQVFRLRHAAWLPIRSEVSNGRLVAFGFAPGATKPEQINAQFVLDATPCFEESSLRIGDVVYSKVRLFPRAMAPLAAISTARSEIDNAEPRCGGAPQVKYSAASLVIWFMVRVHDWPANEPYPSELRDRAAANLHFDSLPARSEFRRIRALKTPKEWRKRGPRGTR